MGTPLRRRPCRDHGDGSADPLFCLIICDYPSKVLFLHATCPISTMPRKNREKAPLKSTISCCEASTDKTSLKMPKTTSSSSGNQRDRSPLIPVPSGVISTGKGKNIFKLFFSLRLFIRTLVCTLTIPSNTYVMTRK